MNENRPRPWNSFTWNRRFGTRRPRLYAGEDKRISFATLQTADIVKTFLGAWPNPLDPPCLNFKQIEQFMTASHFPDPNVKSQPTGSPRLALLDDRRDPIGLNEQGKPNGQMRNWDSEEYATNPPSGEDVFREALDESGLHAKFQQNLHYEYHSSMHFSAGSQCRSYGCDDPDAIPSEISLVPSQLQNETGESDAHYIGLDRLSNQDDNYFVMEFHLPYYALRLGDQISDPRNLRRSYKMLAREDRESEQMFYYEAQISCLIIGVDDFYWTAYCCVDTFFGSETTPERYLTQNIDAPRGGKLASSPDWDPRGYFLHVLSRRFMQVTAEWGNLVNELNARLDTYENAYHDVIDTDKFFDDEALSRTKSYTRAVSILRKFHDLLSLTLDSFQEFSRNELKYFETSSEVLDRFWTSYLESVFESTETLRHWQRMLLQKIQTFDRMKDGVGNPRLHEVVPLSNGFDQLVNTSALQESRLATKQGIDIGVLTNVTVVRMAADATVRLFC
ncbi:uncharacterized protein Z518_05454 [Rhinocladiella mackenziei CBS 650.93]|uniref:Uncharacterized protein n=1 Tax=Rhinocladiella mackenziei CBS 650.93 TaxID=1442369 RepID=A0A0D2IFJ3_9EURO|nr:uncharacterized protein Z518_05454 [Rhinocladiella mackenziei CBS 650.93]KIX04584.1 hypothetical protein Z518_05454 [Rhinocladiella mackenziei CBS 650.93]